MSVFSAYKEVWKDTPNVITLQSGSREAKIEGREEIKGYFSFLYLHMVSFLYLLMLYIRTK